FVFLATYLIYKAVNATKIGNTETKKRTAGNLILAGLSIGVAFMFKFSTIIIAIPLLIYLILKRKWFGVFTFCLSILFMIIIQGVIDLVTWGTFLHSPIVFFQYNIISNSSSIHGTSPFYAYLGIFAYAYSFFAIMYLLYLTIGANKNEKTFFLIATSLFFILIFSFIGHKEYRFILPVLPLFVLIAANGMNKYPKFLKKKNLRKSIHVFTASLIIFSSVSISFFDISFRPNYNYCQTFDYIKNNEEITTIVIVEDIVLYTPGYSYLGPGRQIEEIKWFELNVVYSQFQNDSICFVMTEEIYESEPWIDLMFQSNNISLVFSSVGIIRYKEVNLCVYQKISN
ncbi:MAG: glycosyltransferase family 39 protein, partial [Candidatus Heimdallarchaeota archaeon]